MTSREQNSNNHIFESIHYAFDKIISKANSSDNSEIGNISNSKTNNTTSYSITPKTITNN